MKCKNCGEEIQENARFCQNCGAALPPDPSEGKEEDAALRSEARAPEEIEKKEEQGSGESAEKDSAAEEKQEPEITETEGQKAEEEKDAEKPERQQKENAEKPERPREENAAKAAQEEGGTSYRTVKSGEPGKKKRTALFLGIGIGAVLLLVLVVGIALMLTGKTKTIDLSTYTSVSYEGYNGYGKAELQFDRERFLSDWRKKIRFGRGRLARSYKRAARGDDPADFLYERFLEVSAALDTKERADLKNGDSVQLHWSLDKDDDRDIQKTFGVKLKHEDQSFTVEGLEEIRTFDPFAQIELRLDGTSPNGRASLEIQDDSNFIRELTIELDKRDDLKNGDSVTASIDEERVSYFIQKHGIAPSPLKKEYKIENLAAYAEKDSEVPEELLEKMKKDTVDKLQAELAWQSNSGVSYSGAEYIGNYFLNAKKEGRSGNRMVLVYKVTANVKFPEAGFDQNFNYYYYGSFSQILLKPDGSYSIDSYFSTPANYVQFDTGVKFLGISRILDFNGFQTLEELKTEAVTRGVDSYTVEEHINEGGSGESAQESASAAESGEGGESEAAGGSEAAGSSEAETTAAA